MATSVLKLSSHARSISLPSQSHPLITNVDEHLQRLNSSADASSSSLHTLVCKKLEGLKNLNEYVDDVLQLPLSKQALSHGREEEVLDRSLRLLDICGSVRDIYSQMREAVHELESSLRRKGCVDLDYRMQTFVMSKKQLNKMITKCYSEIKNLAIDKKESSSELVNLMKQVQEVSANVLESSLNLISPLKAGRYLFSKLLQQNKSSSQETSLIQKVQVELKSCKNGDVFQVVKTLEEMDSSIQKLAEVLDIVFRLLVKTRVSLLNFLNH